MGIVKKEIIFMLFYVLNGISIHTSAKSKKVDSFLSKPTLFKVFPLNLQFTLYPLILILHSFL